MSSRYLVALVIVLLTLTGMATAQTTAPPVPTDLKVSFDTMGPLPAVHLRWSAPDGPWFFRVYRSVDDSAGFHTIAMTGSRSMLDYLVQSGHTYHYYVTSALWHDSVLVESDPSVVVDAVVGQVMHRAKGIIAGIVTDSISGDPVRLARVSFFGRMSILPHAPDVFTDSLGHYRAALDTGAYLIEVEPTAMNVAAPRLLPEWFDNASSPPTATPVAVAESALVTIDFRLQRVPVPVFVTLRGTVRDTLGNPLKGARVTITPPVCTQRAEDDLAAVAAPGMAMTVEGLGFLPHIGWSGQTDSLGEYAAKLPAGHPYVVAASKRFYLPEYFKDKARPDEADIIHLVNDTTGIDFSLTPLPALNNSIAGMVRDSAGTGVPSHIVLLPRFGVLSPFPVRFLATDSAGHYAITGIRTGVYRLLAIPFAGYAPAFYKAGAYGVIHWKDADTVLISGSVTGIDIGVVPVKGGGLATLHGTVRAVHPMFKTTEAAAVPGANVYARDNSGAVVGYAMADDRGAYVMNAVPAGSYTLVVDKDGYGDASTPVVVPSLGYDVPVPDVSLIAEGTTSAPEDPAAPVTFRLEQNYPNPFNPSTTIAYAVADAGTVSLKIFDLLGREVAVLVNQQQKAGSYTVKFDASKLASGVYLYRLQAGALTETKRMLLVK